MLVHGTALADEVDEGRKRVLAIAAGILVARHLKTADDLFGGPQGSPRTDALIAAAVQWAERIMGKIDKVCSSKGAWRRKKQIPFDSPFDSAQGFGESRAGSHPKNGFGMTRGVGWGESRKADVRS